MPCDDEVRLTCPGASKLCRHSLSRCSRRSFAISSSLDSNLARHRQALRAVARGLALARDLLRVLLLLNGLLRAVVDRRDVLRVAVVVSARRQLRYALEVVELLDDGEEVAQEPAGVSRALCVCLPAQVDQILGHGLADDDAQDLLLLDGRRQLVVGHDL